MAIRGFSCQPIIGITNYEVQDDGSLKKKSEVKYPFSFKKSTISEEKQVNCSHCGANSWKGSYCSYCGISSHEKNCPNCGAIESYGRCLYCGDSNREPTFVLRGGVGNRLINEWKFDDK